jgi:hypothetical protein
MTLEETIGLTKELLDWIKQFQARLDLANQATDSAAVPSDLYQYYEGCNNRAEVLVVTRKDMQATRKFPNEMPTPEMLVDMVGLAQEFLDLEEKELQTYQTLAEIQTTPPNELPKSKQLEQTLLELTLAELKDTCANKSVLVLASIRNKYMQVSKWSKNRR